MKRYYIKEFDLGNSVFNGIYELNTRQVKELSKKYTVQEVI